MPSPPSPSPPSPRRPDRGARDLMPPGRPAHALRATVALLLAVLAACATAPPPPAGPPARRRPPADAIVARERAYLLPPLDGYPGAVEPGVRARLERAWSALVDAGDIAAARAAARELGEGE